MRLFGGKGLVAAGAQAYYDFDDGWIPLIEQRRPRYVPEATLETPLEEPRQPLMDVSRIVSGTGCCSMPACPPRRRCRCGAGQPTTEPDLAQTPGSGAALLPA